MQSTTFESSSWLPAQVTPFVGRSHELEAVQRLLADTRLVTLTGAGGSGKTRLALEAARAVSATFRDGVVWVELASLAEAGLLAQHVASAVGAREASGRGIIEHLAQQLRERSVLMVLDNCEHLVDACADIAGALLRDCPHLVILATSREAFGITGERAWLVPPLSLPPAERDLTPDRAAQAEAVQLFVDRAHAVRPDFHLNDDTVRAVARICRRLDGLPLAIELAAARVKVLSATQIADRLDESFGLLSSTSRRALPRQRTLREAIDWSYALLDAEEQTLLQRLSVFVGGFTLEGAEAVCGSLPIESDVLELLSRLVDKSLVVVQARGSAARYRLLEALREYAREKLDESGAAELLHELHARYYLRLAEDAEPHLYGGAGNPAWTAHLADEADNLRAVVDWCEQDPVRAEITLRIGAALQWFIFALGWFREGRDKIGRALAAAGDVDPLVRARAQTALSAIALWQGDSAVLEEMLAPVLPVLRASADRTNTAYALSILGAGIALEGDPYRAEPILAEACHVAAGQPIEVLVAIAHYWRGLAARARGEVELARRSFEIGIEIGRRLGNSPSIGHPLGALGRLLASRKDDAAAAQEMLLEALQAHATTKDRWGMAGALDGLAAAAVALDQPERAVCLLGAAAALRECIGAPRPPAERDEMEGWLRQARADLPEATYNDAWTRGQAMTFHTVMQYAFETPAVAHAAPASSAVAQHAALHVQAAAPSAELEVRALGPLTLLRNGEELRAAEWRSSKARELLVFLLCQRGAVTREQVGIALWPDATSEQLRNNFHVTIHRLRKGLGGADWIDVEGERYRVSTARTIEFDAVVFEREVVTILRALRSGDSGAAARLTSPLALYHGDFLEGEKVGDWHFELRERLQRLRREALRALGDRHAREQRPSDAAETFEQLVTLDPLDEDVVRRLMVCYAKLGDRSRALRVYERLAHVLRTELDATPEAATTGILQQLQELRANS